MSSWIIFSLGFTSVFCPTWQDETGAEGVLILPNDGVKKVHVGGKISASKSRQSEHESAGQMREAFQREADVTQVSGNDEAGIMGPLFTYERNQTRPQ